MKFLRKDASQIAQYPGLRSSNTRERNIAVSVLLQLQKGFCAYSERYLQPLDSVELEHFDPRKKNKETDGISNWHAVIRWMNAHKARKIEDYEPLPDITKWEPSRVWYENGQFVCEEDDCEAQNLILFLGVNRLEVVEERSKHIARLKNMLDKVGEEVLLETLTESPDQLSFPSAIESELGIPAFDLIDKQSGSETSPD